MALAKSQRSLKSWSKQKWRTKSGKPSSKTGERYLPEAAIKALVEAKPSSATGAFLKSLTLSATMSPGISLDIAPYIK